MEESKQSLNKMEIERRIQLLRSKNVSEEVIKLVRSDLEDGLTEEQTDIYMNKNLNIDQMKALSSCLHKGIPDEMIALLKETSVAGYVAVVDLTKAGNQIKNTTYDQINPILLAALVYLVVVIGLTKLLGLLERRLRNSER